MRKYLSYGSVIFIFFFCSSCRKHLDKRVSLWRMDPIPYGTKYAYENLSSLFPNAEILTSNRFPILNHEGDAENKLQALMIVSPFFAPEPDEMRAIIRFAAAGNQVFISALEIEDTVLTMLHQKLGGERFYNRDSSGSSILDPVTGTWVKYMYPGFGNELYFEAVDTGYTHILGRNSGGNPDFIRISYDHGGAVFMHLDPFVFSNFFLLHKKNKSYYDFALSHIPGKTVSLEWSDYFRIRKKTANFSALRFILGNRSLKWALWLTILFFFILVVVESKRKQRPVSEKATPRNASEDFVKTVGRLYFQQKNNHNLASKMIAAFLENIRTIYHLPTSLLNEEFAGQLAFRTGKPVSEIRATLHLIHDQRLKSAFTDQELMDLHHQINQFNKTA